MRPVLLILFLAFGSILNAQIDSANVKIIAEKEKSLDSISMVMLQSYTERERFDACFKFIQDLIESLKTPNSFYYNYPNLKPVSILYPEDSTFRIFTWSVQYETQLYQYFGAIQMKGEKLKLFPLFDRSDQMKNPMDTVTTNEKWYGAVYFSIHTTKWGDKTYYNLFGWDGRNFKVTNKVFDILQFKNGKPVFGEKMIYYNEEKYCRYIMHYTAEANATLNYSQQGEKIIMDHLVKQGNYDGMMVPDGSYEGWKWLQGKWRHMPKVYSFKLNDGEAPVENPVFKERENVPPVPPVPINPR